MFGICSIWKQIMCIIRLIYFTLCQGSQCSMKTGGGGQCCLEQGSPSEAGGWHGPLTTPCAGHSSAAVLLSHTLLAHFASLSFSICYIFPHTWEHERLSDWSVSLSAGWKPNQLGGVFCFLNWWSIQKVGLQSLFVLELDKQLHLSFQQAKKVFFKPASRLVGLYVSWSDLEERN